MTLGEKLKSARLELALTQTEVVSDKLTRNMLSAIESGRALPSLDTLYYLCDKLDLPISYVLSNDEDLAEYRKKELIENIRNAYANKRYSECIALISSIGMIDDELAYLLTHSNYELGVSAAKNGFFISAEKHFALAEEYAKKTVYDTCNLLIKIPLYLSFVKNVNAPLLDFDKDAFYRSTVESTDYEFYKYITNDYEYPYQNSLFKKHMEAKLKIKERKYPEAIEILEEISEVKSSYEYNAYLMYGVYGDLEICYKQMFDFENAYKYSCKRISMLDGFKS